jgi:hypothetical protein
MRGLFVDLAQRPLKLFDFLPSSFPMLPIVTCRNNCRYQRIFVSISSRLSSTCIAPIPFVLTRHVGTGVCFSRDVSTSDLWNVFNQAAIERVEVSLSDPAQLVMRRTSAAHGSIESLQRQKSWTGTKPANVR